MRQWKSSNRADRALISPDRQKIALINDARVEIRSTEGVVMSGGDSSADKNLITVIQAAFSPDGSVLALSRAGGSLEIRDLATGRRTSHVTQGWIYGLAFDAAGAMVAATMGKDLVFFDRNGRRAGQLETGQDLLDVSFSKDGRYLATAGADGTVGLWSKSGRFLQKFLGTARES